MFDRNPYYTPESQGLELIGEIDWYDHSYEFDLTVVWYDEAAKHYVWHSDSGCSCPTPFSELEDAGVEFDGTGQGWEAMKALDDMFQGFVEDAYDGEDNENRVRDVLARLKQTIHQHNRSEKW